MPVAGPGQAAAEAADSTARADRLLPRGIPPLPVSRAAESVSTASTPEEFLARLDRLRLEKKLTYARIGRISSRTQANLSGSSAQVMLNRRYLPDHRRLIAFLNICGVPAHEQRLWELHFERIRMPARAEAQLMEPAVDRSVSRSASRETDPAVTEPAYGLDGQPVVPSVVEPSEQPMAAPPRMSAAPWPAPAVRAPRTRPRASWYLVGKLMVTAVAASASAIVMTLLKLEPGVMAVLAVIAASSIAMWTYATLVPTQSSHTNAYAYSYDFWDEALMVTPPVIGA
jgi:hypothetical protein